ncbi:MAG: hypothetical protein V1734_03725 [Nanoarchaeota archaeon]
MVGNITNWKLRIVGLFRQDYLAGFHTREMAKLLGTSHVTLLPHLNALEKEKALVFSEKGRNKVYSLNLTNIIAREYLVMAEKAASIELFSKSFLLKEIYSKIAAKNLNCILLLFGSYAKGYSAKESDIDMYGIYFIGINNIKGIKEIGLLYNKRISLKETGVESFENALRNKDPLVREIMAGHIVLQNADAFVALLWKYCNEHRT